MNYGPSFVTLGIFLLVLLAIGFRWMHETAAVLSGAVVLWLVHYIIAETVGIDPFAYVIPEVLAANIGGAATLIGDPPSTIIGLHLGLGFLEYAIQAAPVVVISMLLLTGESSWLYHREIAGAKKRYSAVLIRQLEAGAQITDPSLLRKTGIVGVVTLLLFFVAELFGLPASVVALTGATWLIVWVRPDMYRMLREVVTTLLVVTLWLWIRY